MCLYDLGDIADYLVEVEASLSRKIDHQQRIEELRELGQMLHYLQEIDRCPRNPEIHQKLDALIQRIQLCDERIKGLIERKHHNTKDSLFG
jgi:hypothetical protein